MADEKKTREELLKMVAENLEETFGEEVAVPESELETPVEPTPDPEPKEKEAESGKPDPTPELESELKSDKDEGGDKDVADDKPELSDAYYRAAKHMGWSDDDIDNLYKNNPELCVTTLGKVYDGVNRATQDFAAIGRKMKEAAKIPVVASTPVVVPAVKSDYKGIDAKALREKYPDDPMVDMIIAQDQQSKLLYDQIQESKNRPEPAIHAANQREQAALSQEARAVEQQIDTFFKGDEAKAYGDFYGTLSKDAIDWSSLTPGQRANRWAVLEMMDQMIAGANACGKDLTISNALEYAHLSVSEPMREKVIRGKIISDVKKRSSGLSLKPVGSSKENTDGKPVTRKELIEDTRKRLNKVFG